MKTDATRDRWVSELHWAVRIMRVGDDALAFMASALAQTLTGEDMTQAQADTASQVLERLRIDRWQTAITRWSEASLRGGGRANCYALDDILLQALGIAAVNVTRADQMRCAQILTSLGFTSKRLQVHGVRAVMWGKNA